VPEVRLIGDDGTQVGVLKVDDALRYAQERDLDLVEVAPEARPPVCRVLDYSKYKYEQAQKQKQARKHQQQITIREIKFRPKIAQHDYDTKKNHVQRFLKHKDKVKVTIMFRGREVTHPERGVMILDRLAEELADLAIVEQRPIQDGRNMTMMLGPSKAVLGGQAEEASPDGAESSAEGGAVTASPQTPAPEQTSIAVPRGSGDAVAAGHATDSVALSGEPVASDPAAVSGEPVASDPAAVSGEPVASDPAAVTDDSVATDPAAVTDDSVATDPAAVTDDSVATDPAALTDDSVATDPTAVAEEPGATNSDEPPAQAQEPVARVPAARKPAGATK